jgi:hypothetical protein
LADSPPRFVVLICRRVFIRARIDKSGIRVWHKLAIAAEYRDEDTARPPGVLAACQLSWTRALGVSQIEVKLIRLAAPLHDVGKIGIPDLSCSLAANCQQGIRDHEIACSDEFIHLVRTQRGCPSNGRTHCALSP